MRNLINLTGAGLQIATLTEIRSALIDEYKSIYGSDIDLSTGSADGVYVNNQALIINNLLNVIQILYSNLDVNTATGVYLDALCALANITRKQPTASNASLQVTTNGVAVPDVSTITFIDQAGTEWKYIGKETISLSTSETKEITVTCSELGAIQAPVGWINNTIEALSLDVQQLNPANVGTELETDFQLRARRNQSSGANGITVLESLSGNLLNLSGIEDVYIYNNNTASNITAKDTTTVDAHSIYVVIRQTTGVNIDDSIIGSIIHEKLTPGIHSCDSTASSANGTAKSYNYPIKVLGQTIEDAQQLVYWKQAKGIAPEIQATITPLNYFTTDEFDVIKSTMINYLNQLPLSTDLSDTEIIIQLAGADPLFKSRPTYIVDVNSITISNATNPDTYFAYQNMTYTLQNGKYVLTFN